MGLYLTQTTNLDSGNIRQNLKVVHSKEGNERVERRNRWNSVEWPKNIGTKGRTCELDSSVTVTVVNRRLVFLKSCLHTWRLDTVTSQKIKTIIDESLWSSTQLWLEHTLRRLLNPTPLPRSKSTLNRDCTTSFWLL